MFYQSIFVGIISSCFYIYFKRKCEYEKAYEYLYNKLKSCAPISKNDFIEKCKPLRNQDVEKIFTNMLFGFKAAIQEGNIENLRYFTELIYYTTFMKHKYSLDIYLRSTNYPLKNTNIFTLACKYNQAEALKFLLEARHVKTIFFLDHKQNFLSSCGQQNEENHNALYYAIRNSNTRILESLLKVFLEDSDELIMRSMSLTEAYREIMLKKLPISDEMKYFIEDYLINVVFFSNLDEDIKYVYHDIAMRMKFLYSNVECLQKFKQVDDIFMYRMKCVARDLHILKRQLKLTYVKLPWEEMEFCTIIFISSYGSFDSINLIYKSVLREYKLLSYLKAFVNELSKLQIIISDKDTLKEFNALPALKRDMIVANIIKTTPSFENLYNDFEQIMDVYSLRKISDYAKLALTIEPKEENAHLIILRCLQVIGEHMKNTLESPKLSQKMEKLIASSLSDKIMKIMIQLRNSLSHSNSVSLSLESIVDDAFVENIQNDFRRIETITINILGKIEIAVIQTDINKVLQATTLNDIREILQIYKYVDMKASLKGHNLEKISKIEALIKKIYSIIGEKVHGIMFDRINFLIDLEKKNQLKNKISNVVHLEALRDLYEQADNKINNATCVFDIKTNASHMLNSILQSQMGGSLYNDIGKILAFELCNLCESQMNKNPKFVKLLFEIINVIGCETGNMHWIIKMRDALQYHGLENPILIKNEPILEGTTSSNKSVKIAHKLNKLRDVLKSADLFYKPIEKFSSIRNNKKLFAIIEMLLLDIISFLGDCKNQLQENLLSLDNPIPLLIGKNLRNHLAHGNMLVDILPIDIQAEIISNARCLTSKNLANKKIGEIRSYIVTTLRYLNIDDLTLVRDLNNVEELISTENDMFKALESGDLVALRQSTKQGADINTASVYWGSALQCAIKANSTEILEYLFQQDIRTDLDDINGQNLLHMAASHGSHRIVDFLIDERNICVNAVDNDGRTPLHIAAMKGRASMVTILLGYKADETIWDNRGYLALHYAIQYNLVEVVELLWNMNASKRNFTKGGFTPLHMASEFGYLGMVKFLITNNADVNARNEIGAIPLHTAALNGHTEVVKALISNGADVNAKSFISSSPLHCAVENGHLDIVCILLNNGAKVNVIEKTFNCTPLNYAALDGYESIVHVLLDHGADISIASFDGSNPLHTAARSGHLNVIQIFIQNGASVSTKTKDGSTALHIAAANGHGNVVGFLVKKIKVDDKDCNNQTPLHAAVEKGKINVVEILLEKGASLNLTDNNGSTPLHLSSSNGYKDITELLIKCGAKVNITDKNKKTPLHLAVEHGHQEIVHILLKESSTDSKDSNGQTVLHLAAAQGNVKILRFLISTCSMNINARDKNGNTPLILAVEHDQTEAAVFLVKDGSEVTAENKKGLTAIFYSVSKNNIKIFNVLIAKDVIRQKLSRTYDIAEGNLTLLHIAALKGNINMMELLLKHGVNIDEVSKPHSKTALSIAVTKNQIVAVEFLLSRKANVNIKDSVGFTPLHTSATTGWTQMLKMLLANGADPNIKDKKNRTALEMSVAYGNLPIVEILLHQPIVDVNSKGNNDFTMLHIASQLGQLEIVKYLVENGADCHARNDLGSKPVHIAAREGFLNVVQYFLDNNLVELYDGGAGHSSLLHYAALGGKAEIAKYLLKKEFDVNAINANGQTALHQAVIEDQKAFVELLIKNGAIYEQVDFFNKRPVDGAKNNNMKDIFETIEKMIIAVQKDDIKTTKTILKKCVSINVREQEGFTVLHYAVINGCEDMVKFLLDNGADPNITNYLNVSTLHIAAQAGHLRIIKVLLAHGAKYNIRERGFSTPLKYARDKEIINFLTFIKNSFEKIQNNDTEIIQDLQSINDVDTFKAIVNARDINNKTIFVTAIHNDFPKIDQLKRIIQRDVKVSTGLSSILQAEERYPEAIRICKNALEKRKEKDDPTGLDIQEHIARSLYKEQKYNEALQAYQNIYDKRKQMSGENNENTLRIRSTIALILCRQGKMDESLRIFKEVYEKQKRILEATHEDVLDTQTHMALALHHLDRHDEALEINYIVLENRLKKLGKNHPSTLSTKNNIAMSLSYTGRSDEAARLYREIYESRKIVIGANHSDTLRTLYSMAIAYHTSKKFDEALKILYELYPIQIKCLGKSHLDTLNTQKYIGHALLEQGKNAEALKYLKESFEKRKAILGETHPEIINHQHMIERLDVVKNYANMFLPELCNISYTLINAIETGNQTEIQELIRDGADINMKDFEGRVPLHFAIDKGLDEIIDILLQNGADCTVSSNKGNTPLHTATVCNRKDIVVKLLKHVERTDKKEFFGFLNARTTVGGLTALHVAAKKGFEDVVVCLLENGATYTCEDKNSRKTPLELTSKKSIKMLLQLVADLFEDAANGKLAIVDKLKNVKDDHFLAVMKARDHIGCELLEVVVLNRHMNIAVLIKKVIEKRKTL